MTGLLAEASPRPRARVAGVVYLFYFLTAVGSVLLVHGLVVTGDPAATARNLLANEPRFQLGFAVGLVASACYVALTALLYELLAPVDRGLSLLAAFFSLMGCAVQTVGSLFELAPLVVLKSAGQAGAPGAEESPRLALLLFGLHTQAINIGFVFFAVYCLLIGYLILRSGFLPRALGVLLMVAGCGWLAYLWPPLAIHVSRYVQGLGFLAELSLMLWLLGKGVDVQRWKEQAAGPGSG